MMKVKDHGEHYLNDSHFNILYIELYLLIKLRIFVN